MPRAFFIVAAVLALVLVALAVPAVVMMVAAATDTPSLACGGIIAGCH